MSSESRTQTSNTATALAESGDWHRSLAGTAVRSKFPWWLWPHLLGLDASIVAMAWQDWWSRVAGEPLLFHQRVILGLGVWMIYLADRLADTVRNPPGDHATARHAFTRNWRRPLLALTSVIGAVMVALTVSTLRPSQFYGGLVLLAAAGFYFWLIHRRGLQGWNAWVPKEAAVGAIFAMGTAFFAWGWPSPGSARMALAVGLFGILCFLNCALITSWERNVCDQRDPLSFLNAFPALAAHGLQPMCWGLAAGAAMAGWTMRTTAFFPLALAAFALAVLDRWRSRLSLDVLRILADAVLLTPWICCAVPGLIH